MRSLVVIGLLILTSGCLARTALDVVTLPVKVAGKAVDMATTSQSEADRNRGRAIRKAEEREAKEQRRLEKEEREREKAESDD
jgi:predicted Holliday junction resolvase-like endonuclease